MVFTIEAIKLTTGLQGALCVCLCIEIRLFENFLSENFNEFATHEIVTISRIAKMSLLRSLAFFAKHQGM